MKIRILVQLIPITTWNNEMNLPPELYYKITGIIDKNDIDDNSQYIRLEYPIITKVKKDDVSSHIENQKIELKEYIQKATSNKEHIIYLPKSYFVIDIISNDKKMIDQHIDTYIKYFID